VLKLSRILGVERIPPGEPWLLGKLEARPGGIVGQRSFGDLRGAQLECRQTKRVLAERDDRHAQDASARPQTPWNEGLPKRLIAEDEGLETLAPLVPFQQVSCCRLPPSAKEGKSPQSLGKRFFGVRLGLGREGEAVVLGPFRECLAAV